MKEQELNKKLAEWAGLHPRERSDGHTIERIDQPNFTQSLDACFKWLVPEAHNKLGDIKFYNLMAHWIRDTIYGKEPALILCLAIEKLIDGGK